MSEKFILKTPGRIIKLLREPTKIEKIFIDYLLKKSIYNFNIVDLTIIETFLYMRELIDAKEYLKNVNLTN